MVTLSVFTISFNWKSVASDPPFVIQQGNQSNPCDEYNEDSQACKDYKEDRRREKERHEWAKDDREQAEQDREDEKDRKAREKQEDADKDRITELKEREEQRKEDCDQAYKDYQEDLKTSGEEQKKWEDEFQEHEESITEIKIAIKEKQTELDTTLGDLKRKTAEAMQELKDEMGEEMESIAEQVGQLENSLAELQAKFDDAQIQRTQIHLNKQKQDNDLYRACFSDALGKVQQLEKTIQHRGLGELVSFQKNTVRNMYRQQFHQALNFCLNNEPALLNKQEQENAYRSHVQQSLLQEKRIKQAINKVKAEIENLTVPKKVQTLNAFKERIQRLIQYYEEDFDKSTKAFESYQQGEWDKINDIRKQQAIALQRRSESVPKDTRSALLVNQCDQADRIFNLFPQDQLFNNRPNSLRSGAVQ